MRGDRADEALELYTKLLEGQLSAGRPYLGVGGMVLIFVQRMGLRVLIATIAWVADMLHNKMALTLSVSCPPSLL